MTRQLFFLALLGLALIPDWATAFGHRCCQRRICCPPPVAFCAPPVFVAPCQPTFGMPLYNVAPPYNATPENYSLLPSPTVEPETPSAQPKAATPDNSTVPPPRPVSPGVPKGRSSSDTGSSPSTKLAAPQPAEPKSEGVKIPAQNIPTQPMNTGSTSLSPGAASKETQPAKRKPLIPTKSGNDSGLPPLPLLPPGGAKSTSKSSPLISKPRPVVDVYPVDGEPPASPSAKRKVGFFNHTDRDLKLTVAGQTVTLPKRHYIAAEVPAKFDWEVGDGPKQHTEIPLAAPGVEVVIRK